MQKSIGAAAMWTDKQRHFADALAEYLSKQQGRAASVTVRLLRKYAGFAVAQVCLTEFYHWLERQREITDKQGRRWRLVDIIRKKTTRVLFERV